MTSSYRRKLEEQKLWVEQEKARWGLGEYIFDGHQHNSGFLC